MFDKISRITSIIFLIIICIIVITPFIVMISVSLSSPKEIFSVMPLFFPKKLLFSNYAESMKAGQWGIYFFNSFFVSCIVVIISLVINSLSGYVFARLNFKFKDILFILILIGMMIPQQVTMIPVFSILRSVPLAGGNNILGEGGRGLINSYLGLILPFIAGSFGVFLCRQYYIGFPKELDDAASIDGSGRFNSYVHIYLPLGRPVLATLAVLKFTGTWNEFTRPLIITNKDTMKTVQLALTLFRNESEIKWNLLMAASFLVSIPVYIVFILAQKHFINGILAGSIKG